MEEAGNSGGTAGVPSVATGPSSDHSNPGLSACPAKRWNVSIPMPGFANTSWISRGRTMTVSRSSSAARVAAAAARQSTATSSQRRDVVIPVIGSPPRSRSSSGAQGRPTPNSQLPTPNSQLPKTKAQLPTPNPQPPKAKAQLPKRNSQKPSGLKPESGHQEPALVSSLTH